MAARIACSGPSRRTSRTQAVRRISASAAGLSPDASALISVMPAARASTPQMFAARELTRNAPSAKMDVFSEAYGRNDLEPVVRARVAAVADAIDALRKVSSGARMTGSGACAFAAFAKEVEARAALAALPRRLRASVVRTLARHPLAAFAS